MTNARLLREREDPDCDKTGLCAYGVGEDEYPCEDCPLDDPERLGLADSLGPLYLEAQDYLVEHELGLAPPRSELSPKLIQAIKFVHGEAARQREAERAEKEAIKAQHGGR